MMDHSALTMVLLIALLAGAVVSAVLLLRALRRPVTAPDSYITGREADAAHLLMNAGMASMLTPLYGPGLHAGLVGLFGVMAAVFGTLLVVGVTRRRWHSQRASYAYHFIAALAMTYATTLMPGMDAAPGMDAMSGMGTMPGMGGHADMGASAPIPAWITAVLFGLDFIGTGIIVLFMPNAIVGQLRERSRNDGQADREPGSAVLTEEITKTVRFASIPHLVMDLGMIFMLVGNVVGPGM